MLAGSYVPAAVATAPFVGPLSPTSKIQLSIGLPLRNTQDLQNRLAQVSDPKSSMYRHYMKPSEFAAAYGPSLSDYQNVIGLATSNGLSVHRTYGNNQLLDVVGPVANIESVFHVALNEYKRADGSTFYAPDTNPSVTFGKQNTQILRVHGLDNFRQPVAAGGTGPIDPACGGNLFGPNDIYNAYVGGLETPNGQPLRGQGQTLALVEFDGFNASDITGYEQSISPSPTAAVNVVAVDGADTRVHSTRGQEEVTLDIEMALAMAPQLDAIQVYEGPASAEAQGRQRRV